MKWKPVITIGCLVIGAGFLVNWYMEANRPPFNLNQIQWMMKTGCIFLFVGSTMLTHLIAEPIGRFLWDRRKSNGK